jgi:hypothetical protein
MKYQKLSKAAKRAMKGGSIPPVRGKVKHWKPKLRHGNSYVGPAIPSGLRKDGSW